MASPFTLAVKLWQHTPLIHFEYKKDAPEPHQAATLRATEVKSRLDKYILSNTSPHKHWLIGKGESGNRPALDYKLQIKTYGVAERKLIVPYKKREDTDPGKIVGAYFGDAKGVHWPEGIILIFTSFETEVLNVIYQYIVPFFVLHNFGQRQTKGFGSFTVSEVNGKPVTSYTSGQSFGVKDVERILHQNYGTVYTLKNRVQEALETINTEYQILKSGRNTGNPKDYRKSKLFEYFINQHSSIRWEKRKIKQKIRRLTNSAPFLHPLWQQREPLDFNQSNRKYYNSWEDQPDISADSYRYIRALLGLAENNEYLIDDGKKTDRSGKRTYASQKYLVKIEHIQSNKEKKIERLASPILFKVIDNSIYLLPQPIDPRIYDQPFKFSIEPKGNYNQNQVLINELRTPKQLEFDLLTFLDYALDKDIWKKLP